MKIVWLTEGIAKTRERLEKQKYLNYGDFADLVYFEHYAPQITEKQARTIRLFLEIACVRKISDYLDDYIGEGFGGLFRNILDIFEYNIGKELPEENPLTQLPDSLFELEDDSYSRKRLFFKSENPELSEIEEMKIGRTSLALTRAGYSVFAGELGVIDDLKRAGRTTPKDRLGVPDPYSTNAAFEALTVCRGWLEPLDVPEAQENNIKFWTWYMDEALPWAVEQTNKRLGIKN